MRRSRPQNQSIGAQGALYEVEFLKREAEKLAQEAARTDIGWGHQIVRGDRVIVDGPTFI